MQAIGNLKPQDQDPSGSEADTLKSLLKGVMKAVRKGEIGLPCCFVKALPFTTDGDLVPMLLPCGCTMSLAASADALESRACQLCGKAVPLGTELTVDRAVLRVVQAEKHGIRVPEIQRVRIKLGDEIGQGAQGRVHQAELESEDGGGKNRKVAVKIVPMPSGVDNQDVGALEQVVATTFLASHHSRHVCRMYGASWAEDNVWYSSFPLG